MLGSGASRPRPTKLLVAQRPEARPRGAPSDPLRRRGRREFGRLRIRGAGGAGAGWRGSYRSGGADRQRVLAGAPGRPLGGVAPRAPPRRRQPLRSWRPPARPRLRADARRQWPARSKPWCASAAQCRPSCCAPSPPSRRARRQLGRELGVRGPLEALDAVRLQAVRRPNPLDRAQRDACRYGHRPAGPRGRLAWRLAERQVDHAVDHRLGQRRLARRPAPGGLDQAPMRRGGRSAGIRSSGSNLLA
jgi:hypothetical protein